MNMKSTIAFLSAMICAMSALTSLAGLQKEMMVKEAVSNNVPILVGVDFTEDDPVFTNWVGSSAFQSIPLMTMDNKFVTDDGDGEYIGSNMKMFVGGTVENQKVVKDKCVFEAFTTTNKAVFVINGTTNVIYKSSYVDGVLSNKAAKVDVSAIDSLSSTATEAEIVAAMKALAEALGSAQ